MKAKLIGSIKTWAVIYPSITLFLYLFGEQLSPLPLYLRTLLLTLCLVPWVVFAGVPFINFMLRKLSHKTKTI